MQPPRRKAACRAPSVRSLGLTGADLEDPNLIIYHHSPCKIELWVPKSTVDWRQIWPVAGRESGSPKLLESLRIPRKFPRNFPGSSPATSPEVLSLWNFIAVRRFPQKFPRLPWRLPKVCGSFPGFPGGQSFLWEA